MSRARRVWLAIGATLLAGLVLVIPVALAASTFLQERMHLYCTFARMGDDDPGAFTCVDGIGYALPMLALGFCVGVLLLATGLSVFLARRDLATRLLAGVAIAGLALVILTSLFAGAPRAGFVGVPADTWTTVMGVPSVVLAAASAFLGAALFVPARLTSFALYGALALVMVATVVEPTIAFGTVPAILAVVAGLVISNRGQRYGSLADHSRSSMA